MPDAAEPAGPEDAYEEPIDPNAGDPLHEGEKTLQRQREIIGNLDAELESDVLAPSERTRKTTERERLQRILDDAVEYQKKMREERRRLDEERELPPTAGDDPKNP